MKTILTPVFLGALALCSAMAGTSTDYATNPQSIDAGGQRMTSANYTSDASLGGVAGISTVASPAETAKQGYIGQLYEVTGLALAATPATIDEGLTRQLAAQAALDDATFLALAPGDVAWSVLTGPLTGIDAAGVATAGLVYQNTPATARAIWGGSLADLGLTVLDVLPDNFGSYAGDGIDDSWQAQYFGLDNPDAAPAEDPDGDGQNNKFEFAAGLVPTDPLSRFLFRIEPVPGFPNKKNLVFSPRFVTRTYTVLTAPSLGTGITWQPLAGGIVQDNGNERTVTDPDATNAQEFYRIEITKP